MFWQIMVLRNPVAILLFSLLDSCYGLHVQAFRRSSEKFALSVFCQWRTESP